MKESRTKTVKLVLLGLGVLLVLVTGYKVLRLRPILLELNTHGRNLLALRDLSADLLLQPNTLQSVSGDVQGMHVALSDLHQATKVECFLLSHLGWVPVLGGDLAALPVLLDLGIHGTGTADKALTAALPLLELHHDKSLALRSQDRDPQVAETLAAAQPGWQSALDEYTLLVQDWERLNSLPPARLLGSRLDPILERVDPLIPLGLLGIDVAANSPDTLDAALGLTRPNRYLVLLQNPWELRPTGGFLSAAVVVEIAGGHFELSPFINSWDVDLDEAALPAPPVSLNRAIWAGRINFRNANWEPDFPTSARWAQQLYQIGRDVSFDGTIAFDPNVIQSVLQAIGPVYVAEYDTMVDAENMWDQLTLFHDQPIGLTEDASTGEKLRRRKEFLELVAEPLLTSLRSQLSNPSSLASLAAEMSVMLNERHLLVTMNDPGAAGWLAEQRWDGGVWPGSGDYLQVVDANVGFNKVDARIERRYEYTVELGPDGDALATLIVHYDNQSQTDTTACRQELPSGDYSEGWVDGCYWTYLQVLTPAGTELVSVEPDQWPAGTMWEQMNPSADNPGILVNEDATGRQVFGLMVLAPPGQQQSVQFHYRLPAGIWNASDGYQLYFQKQSGTIAPSVQIRIVAPDGAVLIGTGGGREVEEVVEESTLRTDRAFSVALSGPAVEQLALRPSPDPTQTPTPSSLSFATPTKTPQPTATPGPSPTLVQLLVTATPTEKAPLPTAESTEAVKATWSWIRIPSVNIDTQIVEVGWKLVGPPDARYAEWEVAAYAAGHHRDSAYPGEVGNVVLTGHHNILGEVFRDLWDLEPGDDIYLGDSAGRVFHYQTREVNIFLEIGATAEEKAMHLRYLERKPEAILTLVTCWPYESNTHRTIVVADLIGEVEIDDIP